MARPIKRGLDYFPFDVDFFEDEKLEAISGEFGSKGELATIRLLCAVYKNGYFAVWSELLKMKLVKQLREVSPDLLEQIVSRLVNWGFFDKSLFDSAKILTSIGIQKRYFEAKKRQSKEDDFPHLLVNVYNNGVNVYKNSSLSGINDELSTQRKGKKRREEESKPKKSKVKKSKVKDVASDQIALSESETMFLKFQEWIKDNAPNVAKLKDPFTFPEYEKLKTDFTVAQIQEMLISMHNYKPLLAKNVSANLTFRKWITKEFPKDSRNRMPNAFKPADEQVDNILKKFSK